MTRTPLSASAVLLASVSEKDFQRQVVRQARAWGWKVFADMVAWRSDPGWPDLTLLRHERLVVVECKTMRGKLTPAQREWLLAWWESGRCSGPYVWTPAHWELIGEVLRP